MTAGLEAVGLYHGRRFGEAVREASRDVGVTSKGDRSSAFFAPPANWFWVELPTGVDFQCPTALSKYAQGVTEFILERVGIEGPASRWPVAERVVDVSEHGEYIGAFDETGYLGQVLPDDLGRWSLSVQVWHLRELPTERQAVQRTEHSVELSGVEQASGDITVPMWFAQLHSADDLKIRKPATAPLQAFQVSV